MDSSSLLKQLEFVQSTNQLLLRNQAMLDELFQSATQAQEKDIKDMRQQVQVLSKLRDQDRRTLNAVQMAREQDRVAQENDRKLIGALQLAREQDRITLARLEASTNKK